MADTPLSAALEAKAPDIAPISPEDGALRTGLKLAGHTVLDLRNLLVAIALLALICGAFGWLKEQSATAFWVAIALSGFCLVVVIWETTLILRKRARERRLREETIRPLPTFQADYFRVGPYEASDRARYRRPDGADIAILDWVRRSNEPLLYLSGLSGAGKSSLLNASLLPTLAEGDPAANLPSWHIVRVPEHGDPIEHLRQDLLTEGAVWDKPRKDLHDVSPEDLLTAACRQMEKVGKRLLILCDQFEVVMLRYQSAPSETAAFAALLDAIARGRRRAFPGLIVLLAFRSDYDDLLRNLGVPRWVEGKNGRRIAPFSHLVARGFLTDPRSGLALPDARVEAVLEEAEAVTDSPGLIRPIALNMLGKLLERYAGRDPVRVPRGALLSHDIRRTIEVDTVREHARPILGTLLENGIRVSRTVGETATATKLPPAVVEGCYRMLLQWPLVRCVENSHDPNQSRWEIAHDFVARLLTPILETPRRSLAEHLRRWVVPALIFCALGNSVALFTGREAAAIAELANRFRIHASVQADLVVATSVSKNIYGDHLSRIARLLRSFRKPVNLDLSGCSQLQNVDGLKELRSLTTLRLSGCQQLKNVDGLMELHSLTTLDLSGCSGLVNVGGLKELRSLTTLNLTSHPWLQNVGGLEELRSLTTLNLSGCRQLKNIDGLKELRLLTRLNLSGCSGLVNFDSLKELRSLTTLDLSGCSGLVNVDSLKELRSLTTLNLSYCSGLENIDGLKELRSLTTLNLSYTPIRHAPTLALLQKRVNQLILNNEQSDFLQSAMTAPPPSDSLKSDLVQ